MPADGLINRLSTALSTARGYSANNLGIWVSNHERREGGIIVVRASYRGRDLVEIDFRSENWLL